MQRMTILLDEATARGLCEYAAAHGVTPEAMAARMLARDVSGFDLAPWGEEDDRQTQPEGADAPYDPIKTDPPPTGVDVPPLSECPRCHGWHGGQGLCYRCAQVELSESNDGGEA